MIARARLQAPRESGAVLADPPLSEVGRLLNENQNRLRASKISILGRPLAELCVQARREALEAADGYFNRAGEPIPRFAGQGGGLSHASGPLLLAGHQPELFHPGVWAKNFALNGLAARHGGVALNLVIDTDLVKAIDLKVPAWDGDVSPPAAPQTVHRLSVPFDRWAKEIPFEERPVLDEDLFASLPDRLRPIVAAWSFQSALEEFWQDVLKASERAKLLGERFASARRAWERRWDCHNWEVPMSQLCRSEAFAWFACYVLEEASRFHAVYNSCVQQYRAANGIVDRIHPVPDLTKQDDWLEVPFWGWRREQHRRGRLLVRRADARLELRIDAEALPSIPLPSSDPSPAVRTWLDMERQGWKLRSRALTTTLFARLFLGDLFIHGIGGAKYDEIADAIIRRFFGMEPPNFLVLSATLHLPFETYSADTAEYRQRLHHWRDLQWNPQRHGQEVAAAASDFSRLAHEKNRWIQQKAGSHHARKERFETLRALNNAMRPFLSEVMSRGQARVEVMHDELRANEILRRRDYSFCLYPKGMLRELMTSLLRESSRGDRG